jgi:hypothetical protein
MLTEAIHLVQRQNRPEILTTSRGPHIYSDRQQEYMLLFPPFERTVSNVESFAAAVIEESRRRENPTGKFMTAIFNEEGGVFYPDDEKRIDKWLYKRCHSQQWRWLMQYINKPLKHIDFLRALQGLRPSINAYPEIIREYRKVKFDSSTVVSGQPMLEKGESGGSIVVTLKTKSGDQEQDMPSSFVVIMPYAKASETDYEFQLEVDACLNENNEMRFTLLFPDMETIIEQALADEVDYFRNQVMPEGNEKKQQLQLPEKIVALDPPLDQPVWMGALLILNDY